MFFCNTLQKLNKTSAIDRKLKNITFLESLEKKH